ncbi:MAG TPA: hypothetical protein VF718_13775 [Allosphingosinicella sp.]|jgi:hypothetical protein
MIDRDRHFALVVGLTKYPQLGDPPPSHLEGPENDAEAVYEWLVANGGGGLDSALDREQDPDRRDPAKAAWRIAKVTSSPWLNGPDPGPPRDEIQRALRELAARAEAGRSGLTAQLGRRLYVFAAGHGFSPTLNEGCLHAGDADQLSTDTNVFFTRWLRLFQEAGYFRETVLWMDCCMNRDRSSASLPTVQVQVSSDPPGPSFVAFAARRPLRAVERPTGPNGEKRGVFTTVLLEGLNGAAVNPYGMITGRSLADWLRNAQLYRIDGADAEDVAVSKEPEILREDQELVFRRGMKPLTYPVELSFADGAAGEAARLWSGRPPAARPLTVPADRKLTLDLPPGMYFVDVPARRLRGGFQVTGALQAEIAEVGDPVQEPQGLVQFRVDAGEPGAEVFVVDEAFNLVARDIASIDLELPFGIYKARVRSGRRLTEKVHMLDRAPGARAAAQDLPLFSSAAPIPGTSQSHEYHLAEALEAPRRADVSPGDGAQIVILAREWRPDDSTPSGFEPWRGVRLFDPAGRLVADLGRDGRHHAQGDGIGSLSARVDPGVYYLRVLESDGRELERALVASPGWRSEAYLLRSPRTEETREAKPTRFTILMRRPGEEISERDSLVDHARVALADERLVLGGELEDLLVRKFDNPIAGIIGGHLLIVEHQRRPGARMDQLNEVVANLRGLVGRTHPDVEALSLRCTNPGLVTRGRLAGPPMFLASWKLLVEASYRRRGLIPPDMAGRVSALAADPPFLSWAVDARSREKSRDAIIRNLESAARADTALDDARRSLADAVDPQPAPAPASALAPAALSEGAPPPAMHRFGPRSAKRVSARLRELGLPLSALESL